MTENQENSLKTIEELLGYKFVVPAYQRGYRWGDNEVRALLEDVWEFAQKPKEEQNLIDKSTNASASVGGDQNSDGQNRSDDKKGAEFYCLQPVVVCEAGGGDSASEKKIYNLIDGQQRLTTIYLILKYLGGVSKDEIGEDVQKHFSLEYDTREESTRFLRDLPVGGGLWDDFVRNRSDDSMDIAHFKNACRKIIEFFKGKEGRVRCLGEENQQKFKDTLLKFCKVLWYESLREQKNGSVKTAEEEIFVKFNAYKIRLTDEENIKALFLSKGNGLDEQKIQERANFWYDTERKLREDDDFCYLTLRKIDKKDIVEIDDDKNKQGAAQEDEAKNQEAKKRIVSDNIMRIGAYLETISGKNGGEMFEEFYKAYKKGTMADEWKMLKDCVGAFEGLLLLDGKTDKKMHHYLGFLIQYELMGLSDLWSKSKVVVERLGKKRNAELVKNIRNLPEQGKEKIAMTFLEIIKKGMPYAPKDIKDLTYGDNSRDIKKLLLLFSLALSDNDKEDKKGFKFNRYQLTDWSLEHIYPQTPDHTSEWREAVKKYCESGEKGSKPTKNKKLIDLKKLLDEVDKSDEKYNQIDRYFQSDGIENLALLDRSLNSSVGNDVFAKKADVIKEQKNKFIPLGTEKVFEGNFKVMKDIEIFTPQDQKAYFEAIQKTIGEFLAPKK